MPIFEYVCNGCSSRFDLLVRGEETPACPECASEDLEKQLSLPSLATSGTHDKAMRAAKKRDRAQAAERTHAQLQYEESHDRHG